MRYFPNMDGARYLVEEIVPRLREVLGHDFEVRLVGHAPPVVQQLAADPNVVVTGFVDDLDRELNEADLVVVPLRHGSGTRLKILEAFAHGIPVVSTSVGAAGIECTDGRDLLLADDADAFAGACARLLGDAALRARVTDSAYRLASRHYDWQTIGRRIGDLATAVVNHRPA
jgi:glycosyltransferase involved in cell wall biosynthesis